jgi:hypothetical protein
MPTHHHSHHVSGKLGQAALRRKDFEIHAANKKLEQARLKLQRNAEEASKIISAAKQAEAELDGHLAEVGEVIRAPIKRFHIDPSAHSHHHSQSSRRVHHVSSGAQDDYSRIADAETSTLGGTTHHHRFHNHSDHHHHVVSQVGRLRGDEHANHPLARESEDGEEGITQARSAIKKRRADVLVVDENERARSPQNIFHYLHSLQRAPSPPKKVPIPKPERNHSGIQTDRGGYTPYSTPGFTPLPQDTQKALCYVLRELLLLAMQDDAEVARQWAAGLHPPRTFGLSEVDHEVASLLEMVTQCIVHLKCRLTNAIEQQARVEQSATEIRVQSAHGSPRRRDLFLQVKAAQDQQSARNIAQQVTVTPFQTSLLPVSPAKVRGETLNQPGAPRSPPGQKSILLNQTQRSPRSNKSGFSSNWETTGTNGNLPPRSPTRGEVGSIRGSKQQQQHPTSPQRDRSRTLSPQTNSKLSSPGGTGGPHRSPATSTALVVGPQRSPSAMAVSPPSQLFPVLDAHAVRSPASAVIEVPLPIDSRRQGSTNFNDSLASSQPLVRGSVHHAGAGSTSSSQSLASSPRAGRPSAMSLMSPSSRARLAATSSGASHQSHDDQSGSPLYALDGQMLQQYGFGGGGAMEASRGVESIDRSRDRGASLAFSMQRNAAEHEERAVGAVAVSRSSSDTVPLSSSADSHQHQPSLSQGRATSSSLPARRSESAFTGLGSPSSAAAPLGSPSALSLALDEGLQSAARDHSSAVLHSQRLVSAPLEVLPPLGAVPPSATSAPAAAGVLVGGKFITPSRFVRPMALEDLVAGRSPITSATSTPMASTVGALASAPGAMPNHPSSRMTEGTRQSSDLYESPKRPETGASSTFGLSPSRDLEFYRLKQQRLQQ